MVGCPLCWLRSEIFRRLWARRVRESTPAESLDAKARAEFMRLQELPENLRKSEDEIWALISTNEKRDN